MEETIAVYARTILGDADRSMKLARTTGTAEAAMLFASAFQLPTDIDWGLRDDLGVFFDPNAQIGDYAVEGQELFTTLTPKAHLG